LGTYLRLLFQTLKGSLQTICCGREEQQAHPVSNPQRIATNNVNAQDVILAPYVSNPQRIATNPKKPLAPAPWPSSFKPSKDRYKRHCSGLGSSVHHLFQTLKGSLQTCQGRDAYIALLQFQTLKGSLQTIPKWMRKYIQDTRFKPSKDRYKPLASGATSGSAISFKPSKDRYKPSYRHWTRMGVLVSNPQRIATNICGTWMSRSCGSRFQTLKGSLQTSRSSRSFWTEEVVSNPQRIATNHCQRSDEIPRVRVSNPQRIATNSTRIGHDKVKDRNFKPSKDRYKPFGLS